MLKRFLSRLIKPTPKRPVEVFYSEVDLFGYNGLVTKASMQKDVYNAFIRHYHSILKLAPDGANALTDLYNVSTHYYPTCYHVDAMTSVQPKVLVQALIHSDLAAFKLLETTLEPMIIAANSKIESLHFICGSKEWEEWVLIVRYFKQLIIHHNQNVRWCKWLFLRTTTAATFTRAVPLSISEKG